MVFFFTLAMLHTSKLNRLYHCLPDDPISSSWFHWWTLVSLVDSCVPNIFKCPWRTPVSLGDYSIPGGSKCSLVDFGIPGGSRCQCWTQMSLVDPNSPVSMVDPRVFDLWWILITLVDQSVPMSPSISGNFWCNWWTTVSLVDSSVPGGSWCTYWIPVS